MACHTKEGLQIFLTREENPALTCLVLTPARILEIHMPTRQERRVSERVPCKLVCPFELTQLETRERINPTLDVLKKLAKALKVTVAELVE
jgi:hypothetical protein